MKWILLLIGLGVLGSLVTRGSTAHDLRDVEEKDGFLEDDGELPEAAYHLFINNEPDEDLIDEQALDDVMLANWFKHVGHSISSWTKKAAHKAGSWTKKAAHDTGRWTKKAAHDTGRWTKKAAHDTKRWTKHAAHDVVKGVKKGCSVVNAIPLKELVVRMNEELLKRGVSEEDLHEEQAAAAALGVYRGIKTACHLLG